MKPKAPIRRTTQELLEKCFENARRNLGILTYLFPKHNREFKKAVDGDPLLFHWRYLSLKDFYIETVKMAYYVIPRGKTKKEFRGLLADAIKESTWSKTEKTRQEIKILRLDPKIQSMKLTRDKYYAHLDTDHEWFLKNDVSLPDMQKIIFVIQGIMVKLYGRKFVEDIVKKIPVNYDLIERLMKTF